MPAASETGSQTGGGNTSIYRVATAYEAAKKSRTVTPDAAEATRELGRARFYDALAGRYGLPGSAFTGTEGFAQAAQASEDTPVSELDITQAYDLRSMSIDQVLELADTLRGAGRLEPGEGDLLGYRLDALTYHGDTVFSNSPVADFTRSLSQGRGQSRTVDLIAQQEEQLQYLTENNADPKAIRGAQNVLAQLRLLQAEQALYAQMNAGREGREESAGFGPFSGPTDLMSLPSSAVSMFALS